MFRPWQDQNGRYAAVIPKWAAAILAGEPDNLNCGGQTARDLCYLANKVQTNTLDGAVADAATVNQGHNVAVSGLADLKQLTALLPAALQAQRPEFADSLPVHRDFRAEDLLHSRADAGKAERFFGYPPSHENRAGLEFAAGWFAD